MTMSHPLLSIKNLISAKTEKMYYSPLDRGRLNFKMSVLECRYVCIFSFIKIIRKSKYRNRQYSKNRNSHIRNDIVSALSICFWHLAVLIFILDIIKYKRLSKLKQFLLPKEKHFCTIQNFLRLIILGIKIIKITTKVNIFYIEPIKFRYNANIQGFL